MSLSLRPYFPRLVALGLAGASVASVACSSEATGKGGSVDIGDVALQSYTTVVCDRFERCYPDLLKSFFGTKDACNSRVGTATEKEFTGLGTTVSQAQLNACTDKLNAAPCEVEGSDLTVEAHAFIKECQFQGTFAEGAACSSSAQCASGSCFKSGQAAIPDCGVCSARVPEGGDCTNANCAGGLTCFNNKCVVPSDVDGACNTDTPCAGILRCVAGKCQRPLPKDADCNPDAAGVVLCDPSQGLRCLKTEPLDPTKGKCEPISYAQLGGKCGFDRATVKLTLCLGSSCTSDDNGTCVADRTEGAACSEQESVECEFPLTCVNGACTRVDPQTCK
jgi:hypothetical protein